MRRAGTAIIISALSAILPSVRAHAAEADRDVALWALRDTTTFNRSAFALAVVGGSIVYLAAELRFAARARIPYISGPEDDT